MMLQALVAYAKREGLGDLDFGTRAVDYELRIDEAGSFVGLTSLTREKKRGELERVPLEPQRTGQPKAAFLVDKAEFVLGSEKASAIREGAARRYFEAYRALVVAAANDTSDTGLRALKLFLESDQHVRAADDSLTALERRKSTKSEAQDKNADGRGGMVLVPVLASSSERIHDRAAARHWWAAREQQKRTDAAQGPRAMCLVTGHVGSIARTHPKVRGRPFSGFGESLVSFKKDAYWSQGQRQGHNAPISEDAARAYTSALNDGLLARGADGRRRSAVDLDSKTVAVFWTRESSDAAQSFFLDVLAPPTEDRDARDAANSPWRGKAPVTFDDTAFYAMTLGPNAGRVVVKDWLETTAAQVKKNLLRWFSDLRLTDGTDDEQAPPVPLRSLLDALQAASEAKGDPRGLPPSVAATVFRSALLGGLLPRQLLTVAVHRMRVPPNDRTKHDRSLHHRVAIIKAVLRRNENREVTVSLDESNDDRAYLLGRLFAAIEKLQLVASGRGRDLNATIRDRYYGCASTSPAVGFARIIPLSMTHASKTRDNGLGVLAERAKQQIFEKLGAAAFPRTLRLAEQGLFAIGYYHQRAALFRKQPE